MATYVMLVRFTEQGIKNVKDSPKRAHAFSEVAKKHGATLKQVYWLLGQYDTIIVVEAPDDITMTALGLSLGMLGNVRTETLRAFSEGEMQDVLSKLA
jgi:uncharacterized protein with GYD domain